MSGSMELKKKLGKEKVKTYIIAILVASLILTWFAPYLKDLELTGATTSSAALDSEKIKDCEESGGEWQEGECVCPEGFVLVEGICQGL